MNSSRFLLAIFFIVIIGTVSAKYSKLEAHEKEAQNVAQQLIGEFAREQNIEADRLRLLDVLGAKHQCVYGSQNTYKLGNFYELRLAVGISECDDPSQCPSIQALLIDATFLSIVNKPAEYSFRVLSSTLV